jgi:virginiamycin A acetyltransferase
MPMSESPDGIIRITKPSEARIFYEEDIIYLDVPVGRMTYGFSRLNQDHLKGIHSIGRFCSIAADVAVAGMHHPLDWVSTNPFLYYPNRGFIPPPQRIPKKTHQRNRKVVIGNDVWIGEGALILRPSVIGHGSVVAAGSVVTKDVPPYAIVAGVPAKFVKWRIPEPLIEDMVSISWWDWDLSKIRECLDDFYDPAGFVRKHGTSAQKDQRLARRFRLWLPWRVISSKSARKRKLPPFDS